jgi:hypothetical protein
MSVNDDKPHIIVISEDDANRKIANGFVMQFDVQQRNIQVLPKTHMNNKGGWEKVIDWFVKTQIEIMQNNKNRIVVLLIDFDEKYSNKEGGKHRKVAESGIPPDLQDRVFILGAKKEPEKMGGLKGLGKPEAIGEGLAQDCYDNTDNFWKHEQLKHNQDELKRMHSIVNSIIFG